MVTCRDEKFNSPRFTASPATSLTCSLAISTRYLFVQIYVQLAEKKKTIMRTIASRRCLLHYVTLASRSLLCCCCAVVCMKRRRVVVCPLRSHQPGLCWLHCSVDGWLFASKKMLTFWWENNNYLFTHPALCIEKRMVAAHYGWAACLHFDLATDTQ